MATETVILDKHGRILIPAAMRKEMGWEAGQRLILNINAHDLRILSRQQAIKKIQDELRSRIPAGRSVVDELIQDRRKEAQREDDEYRQSKARRQSIKRTG
ncbi:MAG TPA: AbrB/MazE/SpoVT family DNA-binding domain-containing protein [Terracidiphilus sp.]